MDRTREYGFRDDADFSRTATVPRFHPTFRPQFTDHLSAKNVFKTFAKTPLFAKNRTAAIFTREFKDIIGDEFRILANSRPRLRSGLQLESHAALCSGVFSRLK